MKGMVQKAQETANAQMMKAVAQAVAQAFAAQAGSQQPASSSQPAAAVRAESIFASPSPTRQPSRVRHEPYSKDNGKDNVNDLSAVQRQVRQRLENKVHIQLRDDGFEECEQDAEMPLPGSGHFS